MRLRIEHRTQFRYSDLVTEMHTEVRLRPSNSGGQSVRSFLLESEPNCLIMGYRDRFGNDVRHFSYPQAHTALAVTSVSEVETAATYSDPERELSPMDMHDFQTHTRYAPDGALLREFLAQTGVHATSDRSSATALALMSAIHARFTYEPGATNVHTSAEDALDLQRGVCQDFAHVLIAACRALKIPARYVSGYLYSARVAERDDAASHAWVDVFTSDAGWLSLDPTHNCAQNERYVRLGIGRDYADVPPTRGTYKGAGKEMLEVKVNVRAQ
jgi:transglutaminase-like putative cysteine protease